MKTVIKSNAKWSMVDNTSDIHLSVQTAELVCEELRQYNYQKPCPERGMCLHAWVTIDDMESDMPVEIEENKSLYERASDKLQGEGEFMYDDQQLKIIMDVIEEHISIKIMELAKAARLEAK